MAPALAAKGFPFPPAPHSPRRSAGAPPCARPDERFCCPSRRALTTRRSGLPIAETEQPPCGARAPRQYPTVGREGGAPRSIAASLPEQLHIGVEDVSSVALAPCHLLQ